MSKHPDVGLRFVRFLPTFENFIMMEPTGFRAESQEVVTANVDRAKEGQISDALLDQFRGRGARFCTKFGARFVTPVLGEVRLPRPLLWFARGSASSTSPLVCKRFGFPDLSSGLHEVRPPRPHLWFAK
ncbi:hypothetical protein U1Q18_027877, partial [Sarracenia purpurea var. burkii]